MSKHTPGPWFVRTRERNGEVLDCFVSAKDVNGFAYDAEIMGEDEYRDDIERKLADARLIAAAPELLNMLIKSADFIQPYNSDEAQELLSNIDALLAKATGDQA